MGKKARALRAGDRIGLIAPSGGLKAPERAEAAVAMLESLGFRVKEGASCRASYGYLAGSDWLRASDLNAFFADPEVDGIVCITGGYGTSRILDLVDYQAVARNPKVFVGYSDITGLHLAFARECPFPTFHGPMGISDALLKADPFSLEAWRRAITSTEPLGPLVSPPGSPSLEALVGGVARGEIVGGNLSLVAALMGTPWEMDARGKIIFIEDVDEAPYRVDRMLAQLRLAGKFRDCAGVLVGDWNNCVAGEGKPSLDIRRVIEDQVAGAGKPTVIGFRAGHCLPTHTIPLGVEARLDAEALAVEILEPALV